MISLLTAGWKNRPVVPRSAEYCKRSHKVTGRLQGTPSSRMLWRITCHFNYDSNIETPKHQKTKETSRQTSGANIWPFGVWVRFTLRGDASGFPHEWLLAAGWGRCRLAASEARLMCIFHI